MNKDMNKKEKKNDKSEDLQDRTLITTIIITIVVIMLAAFIGMRSLLLRSAKTRSVPSGANSSQLIYSETFDNNDANWFVDRTARDFNSSGLRALTYIENGKYYRVMESNDAFTRIYSVLPIPEVSISNFCLVFDSRIYDSPQDTAIVIVVRATEWKSYYYIGFNSNGRGEVRLVDRQIATWEKGVSWNDEEAHTIKISFQDNNLEIYDGQTGALLVKTSLTANDFVSNSGDIRIGLQLFNPNQKATAEIDNIYIYSQCP
jgi:hypothetical protein